MIQSKITNYYNGNRCIYCQTDKIYILKDERLKCGNCLKKYSLNKLQKDIDMLRLFALEIPANKSAKEMGCSYNLVKRRYNFFREKIESYLQQNCELKNGILCVSEQNITSLALGVIEEDKKIFTTIIVNASPALLLEDIKKTNQAGSVFFAPKFRSYASLKFYGKHLPNYQSQKLTISRIEGFWSFAKERFHKYRGINKNNFYYYLKEFEFRFNFNKENLFQMLFNIIWPK